MVSQSESQSSGDNHRPSVIRTGDSVSRRVLEDVLRQTDELLRKTDEQNATAHGIHPADLEMLIDVARRLRGIEFQLNPVVTELVRVTLARQLKDSLQSQEQFTAVADRVARSLFENPESEARLRSLWALLTTVK